MSIHPKVTVCLPTYNRAGYLQDCLTSILNQSFQDFEVVVSDNCSIDSTPDVLRSCTDVRVRSSRNETNIGPIGNMNRCLELARGEYVVIAHDDDLYSREFLTRAVDMLDRNPKVGMVHCAACEIDEHTNVKRLIRAYPTTCILDGKREFLEYLKAHNVCCSTVMMPRRIYDEMGRCDMRYMCWDWLMWLRLALRYDIAYIAEPLVGIRIHGERVTTSITADRWYREFLDIFQEACKEAKAAFPWIVQDEERLASQACMVQSRRFFMESMQASSWGDFARAHDYIRILQSFGRRGWPWVYVVVARLFANRLGQVLLWPVRHASQYLARRDAMAISHATAGSRKFSVIPQ